MTNTKDINYENYKIYCDIQVKYIWGFKSSYWSQFVCLFINSGLNPYWEKNISSVFKAYILASESIAVIIELKKMLFIAARTEAS